ncbi:MAG: YraN family protein [Bacteroidales bacterium]|jgi:putative endonuclease|nr:YraN family protein [Bacteroidales bacterium]
MAEHNEIGKEGEAAALRYLQSKGYAILETNWQCGNYEIDVIARQHDGVLIFCEVKSRTSAFFGEPELFVSRQKQRNIIKAAEIYVERYQRNEEIRFDILAVLFSKEEIQIKHIQNAFNCSW